VSAGAAVVSAGASTAGVSAGAAASSFLQDTVAKTATNAKLKSTFFILLSYKRLIINSEQRYKFFNSKNYFLIFFQKNNILQLLIYLTITVPKIKNHLKIIKNFNLKANYLFFSVLIFLGCTNFNSSIKLFAPAYLSIMNKT
jgi:hypothetical protein